MSFKSASNLIYGTPARRFAEDGAQLDQAERQRLEPAIGDRYINEKGEKVDITESWQLDDAKRLLKGSGTVIFKKPVEEGVGATVYYQNKDGVDILMDGGYHKAGENGVTQYTVSDKDDVQNIIFSKGARARYAHDMREDASIAQRPAVNASLAATNKGHPEMMTLRDAEKTLLATSPNTALTYDYMSQRFATLDEMTSRSPSEEKEWQALGRILFDVESSKSIDSNHDHTLSTTELEASIQRLDNGAKI